MVLLSYWLFDVLSVNNFYFIRLYLKAVLWRLLRNYVGIKLHTEMITCRSFSSWYDQFCGAVLSIWRILSIDQRDWSAYYVCVQLLDWRVVRSIPAITYNARLESFPCSICSQSFLLSSLMTVSKTTENLDSSAYTLSMLDKETFCLSP